MSRNVEIKAKIHDHDEIVKKAIEISGSEPVLLKQHDIFYESRNGRLKVRTVEENGKAKTEIIWYDRPDIQGPKLSDYVKGDVPPEFLDTMKACLEASMGVKGEVKKTRTLVIHNQTRIHIDRVDNLGDFMELEVCLSASDSVAEGEKIAHKIREQLGIAETDLLTSAYMDLLKK